MKKGMITTLFASILFLSAFAVALDESSTLSTPQSPNPPSVESITPPTTTITTPTTSSTGGSSNKQPSKPKSETSHSSHDSKSSSNKKFTFTGFLQRFQNNNLLEIKSFSNGEIKREYINLYLDACKNTPDKCKPIQNIDEVPIGQNTPDPDTENQEVPDNGPDGGCLTSWTTGEWNSCTDGIQTRTVSKQTPYCYAKLEDKPASTQPCTETTNLAAENTNSQNNRGFIPTITGAVTGLNEKTNGFAGAVIFLVLLGAAYLTVSILRRR